MMIENKKIRAENRENRGDDHARTKNSEREGQSFSPLGQWIVNSYKVVALVTLNTLILLACLELAAIEVFEIRSLFSRSTEPLVGEGEAREKNSYYASKDWAAQYWHEFKLSRQQRYYPYVGWRRDHFNGKTINIDQHGIRLTPGADCRANSYKAFVFGGSTIWGTGAPDWGTIPAYLQVGFKALTTKPVCVVNFGESAYVSTQGVIELLRQLQSGNVPDIVLFYDGVNDVYAAYQSGQAGVHQNLNQIASTMEGRRSNEANRLRSFIEWLRGSYSFALFDELIARLRPREKLQHGEKLVTYETLKVDRAILSDSVARAYLSNCKIVSALAQKYGFKFGFFWQPIISIGEKPLTDEERDIKSSTDPALVALYASVYRIIEQSASQYENLYYMGHIFDEYKSGVWIDEAHVTPVGNQIVAAKMLSIVRNMDHLHGDPYAHVHCETTTFDHETYGFARELFDRFVPGTGADEAKLASAENFTFTHHHMGTCRMGNGVRESVVDQFGKIHGIPNLFVVGGSNFVGPSAGNPTLTMVALAIRTTEYMLDQLL